MWRICWRSRAPIHSVSGHTAKPPAQPGDLSKSVADLIAESKPLTDFSGIGKDLAEKIKEIVKTGKLSQLEELEKNCQRARLLFGAQRPPGSAGF